MGEAARRRRERQALGATARREQPKLELRYLRSVDTLDGDGTTRRVHIVGLYTREGEQCIEDTPDGPVPITFASLPITVKRGGLILAGSAAR